MKKSLAFILTAISVLATAGVALAAPAEPAVAAAALGTIGTIALAAGIAIGLATVGPAIGQGLSVYSALQGMARNPEASGTIRINMIIGLALLESLTIYGLVVALILLYAFPLSSIVTSLFN
ncbi:MAG: ATP synthase F0 subunit C [Candidatus Adiutrix sp.]|jgi:F-type H+-transporting ATPase subunit c|nr:ATP synthase F0 subunit C [Candidatus Adiutrix sp.]